MKKLLIAVINVQTQEEIIREMTDEEYAQVLKDEADYNAKQVEPND